MCKVPACQMSKAALLSGRARSWWMVIRHIRQWRQVPCSADALGGGGASSRVAEQLSQKTSAILGETWPRSMRLRGTAL